MSDSDWDRFLQAAESLGFKRVWSTKIRDQDLVILAHPDGLLMSTDSTTASHTGSAIVNSSHISFHCRLHNPSRSRRPRFCNTIMRDGACIATHLTPRTAAAITAEISILRQMGTFLKPWPTPGFIWLLCFQDVVGVYDAVKNKTLIAERLAQLPDWVREFVTL